MTILLFGVSNVGKTTIGKIRGNIICDLVKSESDKVIAVTPMSYRAYFAGVLKNAKVMAIELKDTAENIFERLVFSDGDDNIYEDEVYKNAHKEHYLREIRADLNWYGNVYSVIRNGYNINNKTPDAAADGLIKKFML